VRSMVPTSERKAPRSRSSAAIRAIQCRCASRMRRARRPAACGAPPHRSPGPNGPNPTCHPSAGSPERIGPPAARIDRPPVLAHGERGDLAAGEVGCRAKITGGSGGDLSENPLLCGSDAVGHDERVERLLAVHGVSVFQ
jgi:hypothetical protein